MSHCVACNTKLPENIKFCPGCGKKVEPQGGCPQCGCTNIQAGVKFCPECGAKIVSSKSTVSPLPQPKKHVQSEKQVQNLVSTISNTDRKRDRKRSEKKERVNVTDKQTLLVESTSVTVIDKIEQPSSVNTVLSSAVTEITGLISSKEETGRRKTSRTSPAANEAAVVAVTSAISTKILGATPLAPVAEVAGEWTGKKLAPLLDDVAEQAKEWVNRALKNHLHRDIDLDFAMDLYAKHAKAMQKIDFSNGVELIKNEVEAAFGKPGQHKKRSLFEMYYSSSGKDNNVQTTQLVDTSKLDIVSELCVLAVGGCVWEIKDAFSSGLDVQVRITRLLMTVAYRFKDVGMQHISGNLPYEVTQMIIRCLNKDIKDLPTFLLRVKKEMGPVLAEVNKYLNGEVKSFGDVVSAGAKTITTLGIGVLAMLLERQLSAYRIPEVLSAVLAASLAGIAIVFINRGIDAYLFALTSMFKQAKEAELRYEKVASYCSTMMDTLAEDSARLNQIADAYFSQRQELLNSTFASLRTSVAAGDAVSVYASLGTLNQMFGKELGWSTQEEFNEMMASDKAFEL